MKVLLVDNYDSFTYNLAQILSESKLCYFEIVKNDKIDINKIKFYDKILLSPGPGVPENAGKLLKILNNFYDKKNILGVCLGMQAIAEYFGGKIYNLKKVYHGIDTKIKINNKNLLFKGLPQKIKVGLYHSWAVDKTKLPENLKITAISNDNIIMAIAHKKYNIFGVQFHPESYITNYGKKIIENWLKI